MRRWLSLLVSGALVASMPVPAGAAPATVTILRDDYGVPHVIGSTPRAMAFGAGYALGQDRLFETDVIRLLAQGRLSEILGAGADADGDGTGDILQADQVMRREFYDRADIARQTRALPPQVLGMLRAFSDGLNAAMISQLANPLEASVLFAALGRVPEPWRPEDSVAVLMLFTMVFFAGEGEGGELENAALLRELVDAHGGDVAAALTVWQDLLLSNDPQAPAVVPPGEGPPPARLTADAPHPSQVELALGGTVGAAAAAHRHDLEVVRRVLASLPVPRIGSYGVAATGSRTASGRGLLLGSPQAGFTAPSTFYEIGLHAPGIDCAGFTVPGLGPYVGIGACNGHAWTLVAGNAGDQVDTYVERRCEGGYVFRGRCLPFARRTETYVVKSTVPPAPPQVVRQEILSTVHGPVFFLGDDVAYTHRRSQRGHFARTFVGSHALNFGRSLEEVMAGLRSITATYNLLYADDRGHIAYRFTGWQPQRAAGFDLRLPMPGDGSAEWRSVALPFEAMPAVVDPDGDLLVVNQGIDSKPIWWWPRSSDVFVGRVGHLEADQRTLGPLQGLDIGALKAVNRRIISDEDTITPRLAGLVDAALAGADPSSDLGRAAAIWEDWRARGFPRVDADGDGRLDHPGVTIFGADYLNFPRSPAWDRFVAAVWGRPLPGTYIGRLGQTLAAIESPELFSFPYGSGAAAKLRAAIEGALAELRERFGGAPMDQWLSPAPTVSFAPIGVLSPRTMRVVDHGTYSQIVDLGAGQGVNILPPGNGRADRAADLARNALDGSLPPHFADQIELYERWEFKPMRLTAAEARAAARSEELAVYPG